jgi:signal transduction histidine kinase
VNDPGGVFNGNHEKLVYWKATYPRICWSRTDNCLREHLRIYTTGGDPKSGRRHEVRTPLIGVLGMAEVLSDTNLDVHQRELVDLIRTSGENLLQIINDILDLSQFESGKLELESIPFALRDVIDQA